MRSCVITGLTLMITFYIFVPDIICSIWIALCILSIQTGVLGYMSLWSVELDCLSAIILGLCAGFSVHFTTHISYSYVTSTRSGPKDKLKESLHSLGFPVLQNAIGIIIGISALALAEDYILLVFFKMIVLATTFGALHGLLLLPILLSLFQEEPYPYPLYRDNFQQEKPTRKNLISTYRVQSSLHPNPKKFGGIPLHGMVGYPPCVVHPNKIERSRIRSDLVTLDRDIDLGTTYSQSSEESSEFNWKRRVRRGDIIFKQRQEYIERLENSSTPSPSQSQNFRFYRLNHGYKSDDECSISHGRS